PMPPLPIVRTSRYLSTCVPGTSGGAARAGPSAWPSAGLRPVAPARSTSSTVVTVPNAFAGLADALEKSTSRRDQIQAADASLRMRCLVPLLLPVFACTTSGPPTAEEPDAASAVVDAPPGIDYCNARDPRPTPIAIYAT